ncbi:MAG: hypothetical protein ACLURG_14720 [Gemmiger sp.]
MNRLYRISALALPPACLALAASGRKAAGQNSGSSSPYHAAASGSGSVSGSAPLRTAGPGTR